MKFDRRRFLGGALAGSIALASSPGKAMAPAVLPGALLADARAALDRHARNIPLRDVAGIVDFARHSRESRFRIVDLGSGHVLASYLVAHGRGSDPSNSGWAQRFSNVPGSHASAAGAYLTANTYHGKHGASRRLLGLDPGNNLALSRAIVIHGAEYVSEGLVSSQGRIGRSQGCFAVEQRVIAEVLGRLGPGRLLFVSK